MIPTLNTIIPYLQEDSIGDVSFTLLLELLANSSIINSAETVEHQTLLTRVTTLLKSNHSITRWKATKLFTVCVLHPVLLLSNHTANSIAALVKILESKCFIANFTNPTQRELVTLKSTVDCLGFVLYQIRGKPTLTREVLTPKLPAIIGSLIEITSLVPENTLPILSKLLVTNTTTFRPFGTKFESTLRRIFNNGENLCKLDAELRLMLMKSLSLVSFILSREKQADAWRENVNALVLEIKSVISIYEACLELSNDTDYNSKFNHLPQLPENLSDMKLLFGTLSIDINESPVEIFKVSQRIKALTELLMAYIEVSTPTAVSIPFGYYITIGEILASFNTSFTPVKKDIRDPATREMIEQSINETKYSGINMLNVLVNKFSGDLYPFMYDILAILDASIPVQSFNGKIKVDKRAVYENENLINKILQTASSYLCLGERFNDMSVLGRMVEASLILKDPREPDIPVGGVGKSNANNEGRVNKNHRRSGKDKSTVSLSDILSHKQFFISQPSTITLSTVRQFFNVLLTKCELSPGKISLILRFTIIDAVANLELINEGKVNEENSDIIELLESALLFPSKSDTSVSVIPMIANLIGGNSRIFSLLTNPRFPLLPKKYNDFNVGFENDEIEEEEEKEAEELAAGKFIIPDENNVDSNVKRSAEEEATERESKRRQIEKTSENVALQNTDLIFNKTESGSDALKKLQNELQEEKASSLSLADKVAKGVEVAEDNNVIAAKEEEEDDDDDDDDDMGSDFEIPEINVEDD